MKTSSLIPLLFLMLSGFSFGQTHLNFTNTNIVYVDSTNVRDTPSVNGKIIGKAAENTTLTACSFSESVEGKVSGVSGYWERITFEGQSGYIWGHNLAHGVFKSELDADVHFLIHFTRSKGLEFKAFRNNRLISKQFFELKEIKDMIGSFSLGTTFNSNGNEVIAVSMDTIYKLFEWDGTVMKTSAIQLQDDSMITGKYAGFTDGLINADKVKVHKSPKERAPVAETMDKMTRVKLLKEKPVFDTLNEKPGCWYAIERNGKRGYVWSDLIDVPQRFVKSNKVKNESFLYTTNAIYVFDGSNVKFRLPIEDWYNRDSGEDDEMFRNDFVQFGNRGLKPNYQFLGICYSSYSCGEAGGDRLYLWDGTKLLYFANDFGVGDGAYSSEHSYLFPNQMGGTKDKVIFVESDEFFGLDFSDCSEPSSSILSYARYELKFNGDTLVETESIDSRLRAFFSDSLPGFQLNHASFYDLNRDGITDAVFLMQEKSPEDEYIEFPKPILGVVYGTSSGAFQSLTTNKGIVLENYFSVQFKTVDDTLVVRVNYNFDDYSDEPKAPSYAQFSFVHDPAYNKLVWYEKLEAEILDPESRHLEWIITSRERFKKNKVSFTNAWESNKSR